MAGCELADFAVEAGFRVVAFFSRSGGGVGGNGARAGAATAGACGAVCLARGMEGDEVKTPQAQQLPTSASEMETAVRHSLDFTFAVYWG